MTKENKNTDNPAAKDIEETEKPSSVKYPLDLKYMADLQDIKLKKKIILWAIGVVTSFLIALFAIIGILIWLDRLETTILFILVSPIAALGIPAILRLLPKNQQLYKSPKKQRF